MTTLFISDLHLSPDEPTVVEAFQAFLSGPARGVDALYILGDLFEYWAGDDDLADPFNARIGADLAALAASGVQVFFMRGNRDFLVGEAFAKAASLTLLEDPTCIMIEGVSTLLMHGDTMCTDDVAYQAFRAQVRDGAWQTQFLAQPLAVRKRIIAGLRVQSEAAKGQKPMAIMDVHPDAVIAVLRDHHAQRLIHGHTHRPARHSVSVDGRTCERWVLADWCAQPAVLRCNAAGCEAALLAG